jgi:gas vesicle protein
MSDYQDRDFSGTSGGPQGNQSPEEIEREIQRTRARMGRDIDALGEKLSPENLKQQAKDAVAEKAQDIVSNVGQQARLTGSRLVDFVRENPLPVAAVGLGVTWLFTLRTRSEVSGDRMARFAYTGPERRDPDGRTSLGRRIADRTARVREKVSGAAAGVSGRAGDLADRAADAVDRVQERAEDLGSTAKRRVREQGERARGGLEQMMEQNPLALVAGAAILGLTLGLVLPETRREQRLLGARRDQLVDRVQTTAEQVKDAAIEAGREVTQTVKEEAAYRAPELKSTLKDAAATVGQQVKESASRLAEEAKQAAIRRDEGREPDTM